MENKQNSDDTSNNSLTVNNCCSDFTANWLFKEGKEFIQTSGIRNIDRTAFIFVSLLESLNKQELADKLYNYYLKS